MKQTILAFASISALAFSAIAEEKAADADNTAKNARDRSGETLTSGDQSNTEQDLKVTQAIRKSVVADDALSTTAKNVKIITAGGKVTLRGAVKSPEEKGKIGKLATEAAGTMKVDNQLEVEKQP